MQVGESEEWSWELGKGVRKFWGAECSMSWWGLCYKAGAIITMQGMCAWYRCINSTYMTVRWTPTCGADQHAEASKGISATYLEMHQNNKVACGWTEDTCGADRS